MPDYPRNTSGTTTDGILDALIDLGAKIDALTQAVVANTAVASSGSGAPGIGTASGPTYIDATTGDIYSDSGGQG